VLEQLGTMLLLGVGVMGHRAAEELVNGGLQAHLETAACAFCHTWAARTISISTSRFWTGTTSHATFLKLAAAAGAARCHLCYSTSAVVDLHEPDPTAVAST